MFIVLVGVYDLLRGLGVPAAIGWAIVALTLLVRAIVIPLYRRQLTSQRRMQLLQPEIKEIQRRYKGDAVKSRVAQQELMKERGISPLAGCLPLLLQMPLLFIMYSVIQNGLTNQNPSAMLEVFGVQVVPLTCTNVVNGVGRRRTSPASTRSSRSSGRRSTSASRRRSSRSRSAGSSWASASWPSCRPGSSSSSRG